MAKLFSVKRKKDEPIERLIKRWKRRFEDAEIKQELISRQEFIKPSLQKRIQKQQAVRENEKQVKLKKWEDGIK